MPHTTDIEQERSHENPRNLKQLAARQRRFRISANVIERERRRLGMPVLDWP
jgi:hypothetical protein